MPVLTTSLTTENLDVGKTKSMLTLCQVQKIFVATLEDVQRIGKSALGKIDDKVVRNENIDLEIIYARLAEASCFCEDPPSPPNLCTDTSAVQNTSSSVNISAGLDEDDYKVLKILNEFLNTSDEASFSPNVHRNRLDTFIHQKKNVTTTDNRLSGYFCSETIFNLSNRVLTDTEIKVLEKGLDFAPIQKKLNEPELKQALNILIYHGRSGTL